VKRNTKTFTAWQITSALFMVMALLWLTVSTPFVYASQQAQKELSQDQSVSDNNPFSGTTEERSETGVNTLSEYLHEAHQFDHHFITLVRSYNGHPSTIYDEHHPELISPPPKA
jgi:hypothetical protein